MLAFSTGTSGVAALATYRPPSIGSGAALWTAPDFVGITHRKVSTQGLTGSSDGALGSTTAATATATAVRREMRHFTSGSTASTAKNKKKRRKLAKGQVPEIPSFVGLRTLADQLRINPKALFKKMRGFLSGKKFRVVLSGVPYSFDSLGHVIVPFQDAQSVARSLEKPMKIRFMDVEKKPERAALALPRETEMGAGLSQGRAGNDIERRRPVVVLLGHFNHGKTTILDALLGPNSDIAGREAGGITQEIRARTISLLRNHNQHHHDPATPQTESHSEQAPQNGVRQGAAENTTPHTSTGTSTSTTNGWAGRPVATFLDTPGQEIFYRMRTNGARVADAVVLVISAVDGVCLQTSESIGCAEELGLPTVVALNKVDLLPQEEAAQRLKSLSQEVREFVATESAQVVPISAKTGHGLDHLRQAVAASLLSGDDAYENPEAGRSETVKSEVAGSSQPPSRSVSLTIRSETADSAAEVKAPVGAATATVLDYVSSAKSGKVMLVLVDGGVLRAGDWFVSGRMWGVVRSIYDEEGKTLLEHAGPGAAVKVVVTPRERVEDAPLGEPFRVLTEEGASQVAHVRTLAATIDESIDHRRLEMEFPALHGVTGTSHRGSEPEPSDYSTDDDENGYDVETEAEFEDWEEEEAAEADKYMSNNRQEDEETQSANEISLRESTLKALRAKALEAGEDQLVQKDMPVTVVVKADSANALASIMDAIGDWRDWQEQRPEQESQKTGIDLSNVDEKERGWRPKQRLAVSVARSGIGAVTSSDVKLAEDCESPVFAHNVRPDWAANKTLRKTGRSIIAAAAEGTIPDDSDADYKRGEVVVSETVGELLGEIERFVMRVR